MTNSLQLTTALKKIIKPVVNEQFWKEYPQVAMTEVSGIQLDSRQVKPGQLFVAYPGHTTDGRQYIKQAVDAGATVVLFEKDDSETILETLLNDNQQVAASAQTLSGVAPLELYNYKEAVLIPVKNLSSKVSHIAARFYGNPTKKMSVVGVTGTNGKTSCAYLMAQALEFLQYPTLMLSTVGNGNPSKLQATENTTPDAIATQRLAAEYLAKKNYHMTMEVSSHGLVQSRVAAVQYKIAVFTNLSQDHLDYHNDMESYFQAKRQLFVREELEAAVINADDEYGRRLLADDAIACRKIAYSCEQINESLNIESWIVAKNLTFNMRGIQAELHTPWGTSKLRSGLLGHFNLSNLLAVAASLGEMFGDIDKWIVALNAAKAVPGRMQNFTASSKATVVVDYAHTPDALDKTLTSLREHCAGELWCIFGCGGDRDNTKRPLMGAIAEQKANQVIITDDNPRTENSEEIVAMIREGMKDKSTQYIQKRKEAIEFALKHSTPNDIILVAGKGHEDYQQIGNKKMHYSDLETVASLMEEKA
ncbi:UDP-N-acetylmuramoyl-L-alanyl-D-glutamate--2,6-diaminopimelate ligase [Kangiella sp.]|uniref:UDP-N-acetylmuramoyl-L-alanyl-D-glutamate--2, 6-diaminopimelate ligase n=1 Tax=Kangiella sp. TaxID=1920245 RepID=UPI003A8EA4DC